LSTLVNTAKKVKTIHIEKTVLEIVKKESNFVTDLNTDDQLGLQGIDSLGKSLGTYRPFTIEKKQGQSGFAGVTDHVTLFDVGDFHKSFFVKSNSFPIVIDAKDSKRDELADKYGEDIFGLTERSKTELNDVVIPQLQNLIKNKLGI